MINIRSYKTFLEYFLKINYSGFGDIYFEHLLKMFRHSEKADYLIQPWRRDFEGSRDSLIVKMEKDPELGPWVNRYTHLRGGVDDEIAVQLFCDEDYNVKNTEETFNTDNWIRILTIAAILQEYDEQHEAAANTPDKDEDNELLMRLALYFKDEATASRFLKSVRQLDDKEIITLVKKYNSAGLCSDTSKALWRILHDANLYKTGYSNWNAQLLKQK